MQLKNTVQRFKKYKCLYEVKNNFKILQNFFSTSSDTLKCSYSNPLKSITNSSYHSSSSKYHHKAGSYCIVFESLRLGVKQTRLNTQSTIYQLSDLGKRLTLSTPVTSFVQWG